VSSALVNVILLIILLLVVAGLAAIVWQSVSRRRRIDGAFVVGYPLGTWLLMLASPWVIPFFPGIPDGLPVRLVIAAVLVGAFMAARQAVPGVAILVAIAVLAVSAWLGGLSTFVAYRTEWHGLDINDSDLSTLDMGEWANLVIGVFMATILSPFAGFVIGLASQIGKQRSAPVAS